MASVADSPAGSPSCTPTGATASGAEVNIDSLTACVSSVDSALRQFGEQMAAAEVQAPLPNSRAQLEAEVQHLRRELAAARRGAHISERVEVEMRRVKRMWHESEHRLLLLQSELRTAQVTQKAVNADLHHLEEVAHTQKQRIDELVRMAALDHSAQRERNEQLEKAREAARLSKIESNELSLQMVAASAMIVSLRTEVGLLEKGVVDGEAEGRALLQRLHASAVKRDEQHKRQLRMWEERAVGLIDAGPAAKLDLILMQVRALSPMPMPFLLTVVGPR